MDRNNANRDRAHLHIHLRDEHLPYINMEPTEFVDALADPELLQEHRPRGDRDRDRPSTLVREPIFDIRVPRVHIRETDTSV